MPVAMLTSGNLLSAVATILWQASHWQKGTHLKPCKLWHIAVDVFSLQFSADSYVSSAQQAWHAAQHVRRQQSMTMLSCDVSRVTSKQHAFLG